MSSQGLYLQWEGRRIYRQRMPTPRTLEPVSELSLGDNERNMIIEGDNLQVLASLANRYAGEVDVIYIDPPYNLGKNDFPYSDKRFHDPNADDSDVVYVTNEDGGRHTKWLNFMAPRLYMLWKLLNDDFGVIFISINDVELFRLGLLVDEIFGEENRIGVIVWKGTTDNNPTRIAVEHEYILCYAKCKEKIPRTWSNQENEVKSLMLETYEKLKSENTSLTQIQRKFKAFVKEHKESLGSLSRYNRVDERGPYVARRNLDNPGKPGHFYDIIHPTTKKPCAKPLWGWRYTKATMDELLADDRIIFGKDENKLPELKVYLEEVNFAFRSVIDLDSRKGSNDLEDLFGRRDIFKNPKPVELIELLLGYSTRKNSLIIDAFAGSGTTGEAVLKLNQLDGKQRRFILIEEGKPKDKFCRSITAERVKRAIEKYGYNDGFTFFKTGKKIDREAILGLERDALANLICQSDETGRGQGIIRVSGYKYVIGRNHRSEAICLVWNGEKDSEVSKEVLREAAKEVTQAKLKRPFRIYGSFCCVADTPSWKFCQIPDEILAQMHIKEDLEEED